MTKLGRAARLGITEEQLDDLLAGRFEGFTLEELARIGTLTGVVVIY
jgi:DNA-binding Xre family transcriptional regulator